MTTKTMKTTGGDFATMAGWIAYLPATLTAPEQLDIYKTTGAAYNENNGIGGITTTATNRLIINVPSAERGNGTAHSGAYITNASAGVLRLGANVDFITVDGLELHGTTGSANAWQDSNGANSSNERLIQHSFFHSAAGTVLFGGANTKYKWRNDIIFEDSTNRFFDPRACTTCEVSNGTFFSRGVDYNVICDTESTVTNTYSAGATTGDFATPLTPAGSYNVSADTSATAKYPTGSQNSKSAASVLANVTAGTEDFSLKSGANALVDTGTTVAAVTDDFIGTARPQNSIYDVGAFERIFAGGSTPWQSLVQDNQPQPDIRRAVAI